MSSAKKDGDTSITGRVLLPNKFIPVKYDMTLRPDLVQFRFDGSINIYMTPNTSSKSNNNFYDVKDNEIMLHAKELLFNGAAKIKCKNSKVLESSEIHVNTKATTVKFVFEESLPSNEDFVLQIQYQGFLNNQMAGFYRSTYTTPKGETKIVASTQFEALDARRAFPCVDEPAAKSIFLVTLILPRSLECLSNMPESYRRKYTDDLRGDEDELVEISFLPSPKMSTYLVAFCVGEFDFVQTMTSSGIMIRCYAPKGRSNSCGFALECAAKCLEEYNDFFGVPYPLPKLDMVAIPEFAAGAMENWGLVTYRDVDLLIDPQTASNSQKQRVCIVVCHELAHQWFGNLVTMSWWDDLWLNEGFASWAENWSANQFYPEYRMWDQFVTDHMARALKLDGLQSSHPIQVPIAHAEEVEQVFDAISYCKGGSVVRMISAVLGFSKFRGGLQNYMKEHAYGNTETQDLWQSWESLTALPVKEMMASWTEQMGFPCVKISEKVSDEGITLELEQSWFLADGSSLPNGSEKKLWSIPILIITPNGPLQDMTLMREKTATVEIPFNESTMKADDFWIKINAGQEVPMRVQYSSNLFDRLSNAIRNQSEGSDRLTTTISPIDRVGLLQDTFALVKANRLEPMVLVQLLIAFQGEVDPIVWQGLSDVLKGLAHILSEDETLYPLYKNFVSTKLIAPLMKEVGWDSSSSEDHLTPILRGTLVSLLSTFCGADPDIQKEAKERCEAFFSDPTTPKLSSDIKAPVFQLYLQNGCEEEYNAVKSYFYRAENNAERKHVLNSLGSISSLKLKEHTMEWTSFSGDVKLQDFFYAMGSVSRSNPNGRNLAWSYFTENHLRLNNKLEKGSPFLLDAVIVMCAGSFVSMKKIAEVKHFFEKHPYPKNSRKISQMIETMTTNAQLYNKLQNDTKQLEKLFKKASS